jgi:Flp pilus assembly protein TadG
VRSRGQSLVELAIALPVLLLLALGAAQFVRLAIARAGLDAATSAAAGAAARAPSAIAAVATGRAAFRGVAAGYALEPSATVSIDTGAFQRGESVTASADTDVRLGYTGIPALQLSWRLHSIAVARIEDWRSRPAGP